MWQSRRKQRFKSYINAPITQHLLGWSLVAVLGLVLNAVGFFYWGYDYSLQSVGATAVEVKQLKQQATTQKQRIAQLELQVAEAQQSVDIAQQITQKLQQDNKNQLASVADMQEQIMVYQRLLGAKGVNTSLNIDSVKVYKSPQGQYQYRALLIQNQNNQQQVTVRVSLRVIGVAKNKSVVIPPQEVSLQYFKSVTGEIVLPPNFVADSIEITAQTSGKKAVKVQKKFKWDVAT
jgi:preprotein translocase subunit SecF